MRPAHTTSTGFEDVDFLQQRLRRFFLLGAAIGMGTLLFFRVPNLLYEGGPAMLWEVNIGLHLGTGLVFAAAWAYVRRGRLVVNRLRILDVAVLVTFTAIVLAMASTIPLSLRPDHVALFAAGAAYLARAVYVPCSGRFTFLLGLGLGIPLCRMAYVRFLDADPTTWDTVSDYDPASASSIARNVAIDSAMWWSMFLAIGAMASDVIYGLRREVRSMRKLGQYTLERQIGRGGMGEVWKARHSMLRRPTAVKLLGRDQLGDDVLERFEREVQNTADLTHPNTVTIYDYGRTPEGTFYYAMELIEGPTLAEVVDRTGPLDPSRAVHVLKGLAGALREAHAADLIHRDVKPSNLMLCRRGGIPDTVKVVDFGLVKEVTTSGAGVTHADIVVGTPHYISPEALRSPASVGAHSDVYSAGATAYFLLTGSPPFPGESLFDVCSGHLNEAPRPLAEVRGSALPAALDDLVMRCLAKSPDERPESAGALRALLDTLDVAPWTTELAEAWWRNHGAAFDAEPSSDEPGSTQATFVIDLDEHEAFDADRLEHGADDVTWQEGLPPVREHGRPAGGDA